MPVVCDPLIVSPSTSASPVARSKSPQKTGSGKKSYLPAGVYLKAGPASQAIEALTTTSDDDRSEFSEESSNYSDRSSRTRARSLAVRRSSPRKPTSVPRPLMLSRPLTRGQQRTSSTSLTGIAVKPNLPSPAKEMPSINGTSIDRNAEFSSFDEKKQFATGGEGMKEPTPSVVELIGLPSTSQYLHISRMKRKLAHAAALLQTSSAPPEDDHVSILPGFSETETQNGVNVVKTNDNLNNSDPHSQAKASAKTLASSNRTASRAKSSQNGAFELDGPSTSKTFKKTASAKVGRKKRKAAREGPIKTEDAISKESLEGKRRTTPLVSQVMDKTEPVLKKKRRQRRPDAPHPISSSTNGATTSREAMQHADCLLEPINAPSIKIDLVEICSVAHPSGVETAPRRLRSSTPRNASESGSGSVRSRNGLTNGTRSRSASRMKAVHKMETLEIVAQAMSPRTSPVPVRIVNRREAEIPILSAGRTSKLRKDTPSQQVYSEASCSMEESIVMLPSNRMQRIGDMGEKVTSSVRQQPEMVPLLSTFSQPFGCGKEVKPLPRRKSQLVLEFKSGLVSPSIAPSPPEHFFGRLFAPGAEGESFLPMTSSPSQGGASTSRTRSSSSKFELIMQSKKNRSAHLLDLSPELHLSPTDVSLMNEQSTKGRKRRQPRERFSPDTFAPRRSKSVRSPTSPRGIKRGRPGRRPHDSAALFLEGVVDTVAPDFSPPAQPLMRISLANGKRRKRMKKNRLLPPIKLQRRRRKIDPLEPVEDSPPVKASTADADSLPFTRQAKKKRTNLTRDKVQRRRKQLSLEEGNDVLVEQIAEAAHLYPPAPSINQYHDGDITLSSGSVQAALFSPEPSVVSVDDSSSGLKRNKRTRTVSMPFNNTKPNLTGRFHGQHPLIPTKSRRSMTVDTTMTDLTSAIPIDLPEKNLLTILTSSNLLATQSSVVHARWKYITEARILLRRSLTYNVSARRFKPPPSFATRTLTTKKRNLECFVQQLWHPLDGAKDTISKPSYLHPVELEVTTFTLLKPGIESPSLSNPQSPVPLKREIDVQLAVLKKNPKETLVKDLLPPILTNAVKLKGATAGGKVVSFGQKNKVRLEYWNMNDFLVVNMDSPNAKQLGKVVAFNIGDIKDGLALEVAGHFSLRVLIRKAAPAGPSKVDYKFVMIYATGQHYQVRDMVYLRHHLKGHSCVLCGMRCDSLCTLLRHIEGLHPSMGYEYDEDMKRLYIWFAPEHDFVRAPVPGLVDHWGVLHFHSREDGTARVIFPETASGVRYGDGRPVFQWASPKFKPNQLPDTLPKFDINHVLKIYGVAVNPVRHYLHTNPVQTIRPDYDSLRDYDSDEDTSWQDQYEQEKIHDFIDCNPQEKQLMCLWNTFTRRIGPIFSMLMKDVLCRFVVQHAMEIEMAEAYPALCAQLSMFRRDAIITPAESLEVVTRYRSTLLCQSQSAVAGGPQQLQKSDLVTTNGLVTNGFNEISP